VSLRYRLLNVFTRDSRPLSGNPLCVFEDGSGLDTATMQALARQFNLSETTFLLPSERATARVRIFTPSYEMPFAGHPTLGSAQVCRSLGLGGDELKLEVQVGIIPVRAEGSRWTLEAQKPTWRDLEIPRPRLAALLGLSEPDVLDRPLWVKAGKEQLIVPLSDAAAVLRAAPDPKIFEVLRSAEGHEGSVSLFAPIAPNRMGSRFFFSQGSSVLEDPATGSACANLGGWWLAMKRDLPCKLIIYQGEQVERPSTLHLDVGTGGQIHVGGDVVELGEGIIQI
jgi:trans-2,3-dihydro-3-hydroxyanthranilate isomerase